MVWLSYLKYRYGSLALKSQLNMRIFEVVHFSVTYIESCGNDPWQATVAPPVTGKMQKGIALCYTVVFVTFYPVAISGYWAFGNQANGNIFDNLVPNEGPQLLPQWLVGIASIAIVLQLLAIGLVCLMDVLAFKSLLYHARFRV